MLPKFSKKGSIEFAVYYQFQKYHRWTETFCHQYLTILETEPRLTQTHYLNTLNQNLHQTVTTSNNLWFHLTPSHYQITKHNSIAYFQLTEHNSISLISNDEHNSTSFSDYKSGHQCQSQLVNVDTILWNSIGNTSLQI